MSMPKINLRDGKHHLIVAEDGERVLTPKQNQEYEREHPHARKKPMQARVYDEGGDLPAVSPEHMQHTIVAAPDVQVKGPGLMNRVVGGLSRMDTTTQPQEEPDAPITPYHGRLQWAFDEGGNVGGYLKKIGDKASTLYSQGKALLAPEEDEARSFAQKRKQIEEATTPIGRVSPKEAPPAAVPAEADRLHPAAKYGDRPGEKRIDVTDMVKPLYDEGGTVSEDEDKVKAAEEDKKEQPAPREVEVGPLEDRSSKLVAFGGEKSFHNPKGFKVQADTDQPEPNLDYKLEGAKMNTDKAPLGAAHMDVQNAPIEGPIPTPARVTTPIVPSTKLRPLQGVQTEPVPQGVVPDQIVEVPPSPKDIVQKDKIEAMKKGTAGLTDLGTALIHERQLDKDEKPYPYTQGAGPRMPAEAPAEAGLPVIGREGQAGITLPTPQTPHAAFEAKRRDYDQRIQAAMDRGTPEGDREAASLQLAKQHFEKMNPLGSAANKPGFVGKLEHTLGRIGNIAGNIVAPGTMAAIPGTDLHKEEEAAGARARQTEATKEELDQAQAKAAAEKTPMEKYTYKNVQDTRKTLPSGEPNPNFGKTVVAGVSNTDPSDVQFTGQVAPPAAEKPETAEEHKNRYAELRARIASGEKLGPEDQKELGTLQTQLSVGASNADQFNKRIDDLGVPVDIKGNYKVNATDTDAEAKEKEIAARELMAQRAAAAKKTGDKEDKAAEQAGKVYDKYSANLDKLAAPLDAATTRSTLLLHNLDQKTKQGDALIAPELLSIAAGGQGSGLRMNEAEIARIIGGRSVWDALVAHAKQIQESGGTFDDVQRGQLREITAYINNRNAAEVALINQGREALLRVQDNEEGIRTTYSHVHQAISDLNSKGIVPPGGKVNVGDYVFHNGDVVKITSVKGGKPQGEVVTF